MADWVGILLIVLGGLMQGTYFLPMKYVRPWAWENIWSLYSVLALILMPLGLAAVTTPQLWRVLTTTPARDLSVVFLYGAGWGIGSVLSGVGVDYLGLALGVAVLIGIAAALGSLVPLVVLTPQIVFKTKGLMMEISVAALLFGVALVGIAGKKRDESKTKNQEPRSFAIGMIVCIVSGIFSGLLNLAFSFSQGLVQTARHLGAGVGGAQAFVWMIALAGGFIANGIYTAFLLTRNKNWHRFFAARSGRGWLLGVGMAALWLGGMLAYGRGSHVLGALGTIIGWPLFLASLIIFSSLWGFVSGEWTGASLKAKKLMAGGLAVLVIASVLLGITNRM